MFADAELADLIFAQNREFFTSIGPAADKSGLNLGTPVLDTGTSIAFFGGEGNPITQTNGKFTPSDIDAIVDFYKGRASWVEVLLNPFADPAAFDRLNKLGATLSRVGERLVSSCRHPFARLGLSERDPL